MKLNILRSLLSKCSQSSKENTGWRILKNYRLLGIEGEFYKSTMPGILGAWNFGRHRKLKIYEHLDGPSASLAIAKGQYTKYRASFKDEETAVAVGFAPCVKCIPQKYKSWKASQGK